MADTNPKVMEMIEAELKKKPDTSNAELLEKAKKIDSSVGKLSARQFNARYPLQVKRKLNPPKRRKRRAKSGAGRSRGAGKGSASRDRVKDVLLQLARDVADAQGKGELVDVVAGIDAYVDRVVKAAG